MNCQTTQIPLYLIEHFVKSLGLANTFNTIHLSVSWWTVLWQSGKVTCILDRPLTKFLPCNSSVASLEQGCKTNLWQPFYSSSFDTVSKAVSTLWQPWNSPVTFNSKFLSGHPVTAMLQPCFHPVMDISTTARELAQLARLFLHCGIPLTALVQVSCITTLLQLVNWQLTRLFFFLPGANVVILHLTQSTL